MRPLLALAALFVLLTLGAALWSAFDAPRFDPVAYARLEAEAARIERQAQIADAVAPVDLALAVFWRVLPAALVLLAVAGAAAWGGAALARFRRERTPDDRGLLPVEVVQLPTVAPAALGAFHTARLAEAQQQPVPHALTFSPHYSHRIDGAGAISPPVAELLPAGALPSFAALLDAGRVGKGNPLLLGYDLDNEGAELPGSWADLYSTATAGLPGTGKTTSQRFFACQTALHGARFVVCDPHASAGPDSLAATLAPLRGAFMVEPAEAPKDILEAARYVRSIGDARIHGKSDDRTPVILWVDELTSLLGRSDVGDALGETLEAIAQEHRKVACFLAASGQIWSAARTPTALRDSLASVLCHRMKRGQARLLLPTEEAAQVERLGTGEAILWRTSGATSRVRIPNTTAEDVQRVAALLGGAPTSAAASAVTSTTRVLGFRPPAPGSGNGSDNGSDNGVPTSSASGSAAAPSAEDAHILALFLAGKSTGEIAETIAGSKGGRAYQAAAARVAEVLRRALARKGAANA